MRSHPPRPTGGSPAAATPSLMSRGPALFVRPSMARTQRYHRQYHLQGPPGLSNAGEVRTGVVLRRHQPPAAPPIRLPLLICAESVHFGDVDDEREPVGSPSPDEDLRTLALSPGSPRLGVLRAVGKALTMARHGRTGRSLPWLQRVNSCSKVPEVLGEQVFARQPRCHMCSMVDSSV